MRYKFNELPTINFPKNQKVVQYNSLTIDGVTETVRIIARLEFVNELFYYLLDGRIIVYNHKTFTVYQKGKRIIEAESFLYLSSTPEK